MELKFRPDTDQGGLTMSDKWKRKDDVGIIGKIRKFIHSEQVKVYTREEIEEYARERGLAVARNTLHVETKKSRKLSSFE